MAGVCDIKALETIISLWPGVQRRQTRYQIVFSVSGRPFSWLSPGTGMVQIAPPLGRDEKTRRLERHGARAKVIRQLTGDIDAEYNDPGLRLKPRFSYPGFMCSQTPQDEAESLVRQAYLHAQGNAGGRVSSISRGPSPSSSQSRDPRLSSNKVVQVPMEEELIQALDSWSQKLGRSRADIIREACRRYLRLAEREELDRIYREGYDRVPEEPIMALTQAALLAEVLPKEEW